MWERWLYFFVSLGSLILSCFDTLPSHGVVFLHITARDAGCINSNSGFTWPAMHDGPLKNSPAESGIFIYHTDAVLRTSQRDVAFRQ
ncbi:hypothetical protein BDR07DRAFT_1404695 [Suillus spraguei]|nr:hypothetical protein BDR07DRAFT_1404695 [Suillus spraguei]